MRKAVAAVLLAAFCSGLLPGAENQNGSELSWEIIIPGLLQFKEKKWLKGGIFLVGTLATGMVALLANGAGNRHYDEYLAATQVDEVIELRSDAERDFRLRNICIAGLAVIWVIHILDISLGKDRKGRINSAIENGGFSVGFSLHF